MCRDRAATAFRGIDDKLDLFEREGGRGLTSRTPTVVGVDFDPVRAPPDLIAHNANQAVAIRFFGPLRHAPLGRITLWAVASCRDDRPRHNQHSRTWNDALLDGLLQTDIRISCALGSEIANRRVAGHERVSQVIRRASHTES